MATAYLLLGSNQGNRLSFLAAARLNLTNTVGRLAQQSAIYETAAWGLEAQSAFLNQVLEINTPLSPAALLTHINIIENDLGRVREVRWGARGIDIDILYYEDLILQTQKLTIPHPHLHNRRFTLVPLVEIAPNYVHPIFKITNEALLNNCEDALEVRVYKADTF